MDKVDTDAIWEGYDLAWPGRRWIEKEVEEEDPSIWDEYWKWSPEG